MKKYVLDLTVVSVERIHARYVLIRLTDAKPLPDMSPGQFVEVRVDGSPSTFLRRPISINYVDRTQNQLWLLVATVGDGTKTLATLQPGSVLNCVLPLGNGFTPVVSGQKVLLVGGGVGVAPLLYMGAQMLEQGIEPTFLLGARTQNDLLMLDEFKKYGRVFITTEDGSSGPTPMMKAVARLALEKGIDCEVSLENLMACGVGACLCCVEKTTEGNLCVCKEGPVFNIKRLLWQS